MPAPRARLVRRRDVVDFDSGAADLTPRDPGPRGRRAELAAAALAPLTAVHCVDLAPGEAPLVALTYDDGPHPEHTPRVLDELAAAGARATFFVLVRAAEAHPELVARMLAEGHEVALHGIDHRRLNTLPPREAFALVREGRARLAAVTGAPVRLFRPPYGAQSPLQAVLTRLSGLEVVIWSSWARDWQDDDEATTAARAVTALHPGGVVLLHDAYGEALTAPSDPGPGFDRGLVTRLLLAGVAERGLEAVTVSELLARRGAVRSLWVGRT